jgi:hypothetical protein
VKVRARRPLYFERDGRTYLSVGSGRALDLTAYHEERRLDISRESLEDEVFLRVLVGRGSEGILHLLPAGLKNTRDLVRAVTHRLSFGRKR